MEASPQLSSCLSDWCSTSKHGILVSILCPSVSELWWKTLHCDVFFSKHFNPHLSFSGDQCSVFIHLCNILYRLLRSLGQFSRDLQYSQNMCYFSPIHKTGSKRVLLQLICSQIRAWCTQNLRTVSLFYLTHTVGYLLPLFQRECGRIRLWNMQANRKWLCVR
jgi:hypothetical protein